MTKADLMTAMAVLLPALAGAIVMVSKEFRCWIVMSRRRYSTS